MCKLAKCSVTLIHGHGYCRIHYERFRKYGSPYVTLRGGPKRVAPEKRFWPKVEKGPGCWRWKAYMRPDGYGEFSVSHTENVGAHRYAYQLVRGPVPAGLQLDHLCRNRGCVNPWHLEPVTAQENTLRGTTLAAENAKKIHCPRGHLYSEQNTYHYSGRRFCRTCHRTKERDRKAKLQATA
jgi:hypothetical protein